LPEALLYILLYLAMAIATAIYIYATTTPYERAGVHARIIALSVFWPALLVILLGMFLVDVVNRVRNVLR
jgi:hypothetical protein